MQKSTNLGAALIAAGAGNAMSAASAAGHGNTPFAVAFGIASAACTALGVTLLIVGWATRPRERGETEKV